MANEKVKVKTIFPLIQNVIREINRYDIWAEHDTIVEKLLLIPNIADYISDKDISDPLKIRVGRRVAWFSKYFSDELKGISRDMQEYISEFEQWVKKKESENYAYRLAISQISEEIDISERTSIIEGNVTQILVNKYERSIKARNICINHHGLDCKVCEINFKEIYGEIGKGFIHVHHLKAIHTIGKEYILNPITELVPVCANCHAMLHIKKPEPYTIEELKEILKERNSKMSTF